MYRLRHPAASSRRVAQRWQHPSPGALLGSHAPSRSYAKWRSWQSKHDERRGIPANSVWDSSSALQNAKDLYGWENSTTSERRRSPAQTKLGSFEQDGKPYARPDLLESRLAAESEPEPDESSDDEPESHAKTLTDLNLIYKRSVAVVQQILIDQERFPLEEDKSIRTWLGRFEQLLEEPALTGAGAARILQLMVKAGRLSKIHQVRVLSFLHEHGFWMRVRMHTIDRLRGDTGAGPDALLLASLLSAMKDLNIALDDEFAGNWFHAAEDLRSFEPDALAVSLHGLVSLRAAIPGYFMRLWFARALKSDTQWSRRSIQAALSALAKGRFDSFPQQPKCVEKLVLHWEKDPMWVSEGTPSGKDLCALLTSIAKLRWFKPSSGLLEKWYLACEDASFDAQGLANSIWALGSLRVENSHAFRRFWALWRLRYSALEEGFNRIECMNVFWASGRLKLDFQEDLEVAHELIRNALYHVNEWTAEDCSTFIWSLSCVGQVELEASHWDMIESSLFNLDEEFNKKQLYFVAKSLVTLEAPINVPGKILETRAKLDAKKEKSSDPTSLSREDDQP
ncbi:hypothetical protein FVE85_9097 [Porphyridium purpureum]|uniref:Tbc2 translation factor, chloroplastic n=1 Tax=Porphyridium purpureum TaxID=35688 RepID=A0A5J4YNQ3_PORPP|nr:hypothetical protein FVE85_9097 [Porphyridium purpureum]|eukprot:POR6541..scf222_8